MKQKNQKGGFLSMLLGTLGASLLGNLLTGTFRADKGTIRAGHNVNVTSSFNKFRNTNLLSK